MVAVGVSAFHKTFRMDNRAGTSGSNFGQMAGQEIWHRAVVVSGHSRSGVLPVDVWDSQR